MKLYGDKVGVASVVESTRVVKLGWFGHVKRRCVDQPIRCERLPLGCSKSQEVGQKRTGEVIKQDMAQLQLTEHMTIDRKVWRSRIRVESQQVAKCYHTSCGRGRRVAPFFSFLHVKWYVVSYSSMCITISCFICFVSCFLLSYFSCNLASKHLF